MIERSYTYIRATAFVATALTVGMVAYAVHADPSQDAVNSTKSRPAVNSFGSCVRTKWVISNDPCGVAVAAVPVVYTPPPVPIRQWGRDERTVYFEFNHATLDAAAKQKIDGIAQALKHDAEVKSARVVGYADRIGNAGYNEKLSQRRAQAVQDYLVERGFVRLNSIVIRWVGAKEPSAKTHCSDTLKRNALIDCLQPDRRVEIEVDYLTDGKATE